MTTQESTALVQVNPGTDTKVWSLYQEGVKLQEWAAAMVVQDDAGVLKATDDLSVIAGVKKAIEAKRQEYTKPLRAYVETINAAFRDFTDPLNQADSILRGKVLDYRAELERQRLAQEEINRLREEAAAKEMALKGELTEPVGQVEVAPEARSLYHSTAGTLGTRKNRKWVLEDMALVPREYLILDAGKIGKVVKAGIPSIPGIHIYDEPGLTVRAQKPEQPA